MIVADCRIGSRKLFQPLEWERNCLKSMPTTLQKSLNCPDEIHHGYMGFVRTMRSKNRSILGGRQHHKHFLLSNDELLVATTSRMYQNGAQSRKKDDFRVEINQ